MTPSSHTRIYLDNAATTPLRPEVAEVMRHTMESTFGNPSSIHSFGREARVLIENARKTVAGLLGISPAELFFTSGGTEANNMALQCGVRGLGIKQVITSPIEHHAVLHTLEVLEKAGAISIHFVNLTDKGHVDLDHLEKLLKSNGKSLVSLMHANNEIGNITSLKKVGELCGQYDAVFHSDTVQTMAHYRHDLSKLNVHFANCAPHKFHGPKGVGFLYINSKVKIQPLLYGGAQERNMRGGTENVYGIAGLAKAMEIAYSDMDGDHQYIQGLKTYMITRLRDAVPGVQFNGDAEGKSLYTVLNVSFPPSDISEMLLFKLDIEGIAVSGGSACASGSNAGSHVLKALGVDPNRPAVRFSFSKYNTKEEIDFCIEKLKSLFIAKTYRG